MNESAVIRLLHQGLPCEQGHAPAAPFSIEALARSPLRIEPDAENASDWVEREAHGLCWLERPAPGLPAPVYITGAASSSLDAAKALLKLGILPEWASVLSLSQSAGRGQMRRAWASPEGNLYAALRLPNEGPFAGTAAAPAIGGLLAEALENEGAPVMLKWPNDIMQHEKEDVLTVIPKKNACRKVGGILLEERFGALVAGIGINVETWILDDFQGDLYGKEITLEFYYFIRPEIRFPSLEALQDAVYRDAEQTREILSRISK